MADTLEAFGIDLTGAVPTQSPQNSAKADVKLFMELMKTPGMPVENAARLAGMSLEDAMALQGASASQQMSDAEALGLRGAPDKLAESATFTKMQAEELDGRSAQRDALVASGRLVAADKAIEQSVRNREGILPIDPRGAGLVPAVGRFLDTWLEGTGIDVIPGSPEEYQEIDVGQIEDVAQRAQQWPGAISNFENELFIKAASGLGKEPRFNRVRAAAAMGRAASGYVHSVMHDALNDILVKSGQNSVLASDSAVSKKTARDAAVKWLQDKGYLTKFSGTPEELAEKARDINYISEVANSFATFANGGNEPLIREAFMRALYAERKNVSMDSPEAERFAKLYLEGKSVADIESMMQQAETNEAAYQDANAKAQEAAATVQGSQDGAASSGATEALAPSTPVVTAAPAQDAAQSPGATATETPAAPEFATPADFETFVTDLVKQNQPIPDAVRVGGQLRRVNKFADADAAQAYLEGLRSQGKPIPKKIIVGNKIYAVK